jgi:molybdate transport system regulatory protein
MLWSSITHESCVELKLELGAKAFALIKASSIELSLPGEESNATRNRFNGTVRALTRGDRRSELCVAIDEGPLLVCTAENAIIDRFNLNVDVRVGCQVDPSNVIIAVAS